MRRILVRFFIIFIVAIVCTALYFGVQYAYIGSAYASKMACSCHFLSGRNLEEIRQNDLYAVPFVSVNVNEETKTVTSHVLGIAKTTALFREGFGCTLLNGISEEVLKKSTFSYKRKPVPHRFEKGSASDYFDTAAFNKVINKAFYDSTGKLQTRAVIVLKEGKLICEKYADGFGADTRLMGWSMTKSITNAMTGILVKKGILDVQKPAPVPEWQKDERKEITLNNLLRMQSGLDFEEIYSKPSDATHMLFRSAAAGLYAMKSKLKSKPGSTFYYSSGTTNIIQEIIKSQFHSLELYHRFPYEELFDKTGMSSAVLETDASGTFVGSSFMFATAMDWARFGQLYLQKGIWNGEEVLPEGWTDYSSSETPGSGGKYAAHFWINHHIKSYPPDGYYASGFEGQYINILPSEKMVVVRLGCSHGGVRFDNAAFVSELCTLSKKP